MTDLTIERMRLATVGNNRDPATVYNGPLPCETGRPPYCWWPPTSVEGKKRLKSAFCNEKKVLRPPRARSRLGAIVEH